MKTKSIKLVEKRDHLIVHGIFISVESAQRHLDKVVPEYVRLGYYMDKSLKPEDFEIVVS